MAWWYEKGGVATGPIAHEDLHNMILSEELTADTLVWCSGMGEWWAYTSLVSEFGPDVLEWCATNMTEFNDTELCPPPMPSYDETDIVVKQLIPINDNSMKNTATKPMEDFVGDNTTRSRKNKSSPIGQTHKAIDFLSEADWIVKKAIVVVIISLFTILFIITEISKRDKIIGDLVAKIIGYSIGAVIILSIVVGAFSVGFGIVKSILTYMRSNASTLIFIIHLVLSVAYIQFGYVGANYLVGPWLAAAIIFMVILFNIPIAITMFSFICFHCVNGVNVMYSMLLSMPMLIVFVVSIIIGQHQSIFKWLTK